MTESDPKFVVTQCRALQIPNKFQSDLTNSITYWFGQTRGCYHFTCLLCKLNLNHRIDIITELALHSDDNTSWKRRIRHGDNIFKKTYSSHSRIIHTAVFFTQPYSSQRQILHKGKFFTKASPSKFFIDDGCATDGASGRPEKGSSCFGRCYVRNLISLKREGKVVRKVVTLHLHCKLQSRSGGRGSGKHG